MNCVHIYGMIGVMIEPLVVSPVFEARQQLSQVLARFRVEGDSAEPMILGSHRSPEAVLLSYDRYRALLDELAELHAFRRRYRASVTSLASVRLEGGEPDMFGHAVRNRVVEGKLTNEEAVAELVAHYRRPRGKTGP